MTPLTRDQLVAAAGGDLQVIDAIWAAAGLTMAQKATLQALFRSDGPQMRRRPGRHMLARRMNRRPSPVGRDLEELKRLGWITLIEGQNGSKRWVYSILRDALSGGMSTRKRNAPSRTPLGAPEGISTAPSEGTEVAEVAVEVAPPLPPEGGDGVSLRSPNGNGNGHDELAAALDHFARLTNADQAAALNAVPQPGRLKLQPAIVRQIAALRVWRERTTV
jgi:hypothetical protein